MKVLIVDDEQSVHDQLEQMIPWSELGWSIVGHAYNGEEAKRIVMESNPHFTITDIKMPLTDGLGFMEWLKSSQYRSKVLVLSGYGDFEYLRPAFLLDAIDYLLKPIQQAEFLTVLSKIVEQIQNEGVALKEEINEKAILHKGIVLMQDQFMSEVIDGTLQEENEMIVRAEQLLLQLPEAGYYAVVIKLTDLDEYVNRRYERDREVLYYAFRNVLNECMVGWGVQANVFRNLYKTNEFLILVSVSEKSEAWLEKTLHRLSKSIWDTMQVKVKFGVSQYKSRITFMEKAYREAVRAIEGLRLGDDGAIAYYEQSLQSIIESKGLSEWRKVGEMLEMLVHAGSLRDGVALLSKLDGLVQDGTLIQMSGLEMKQAINLIVSKIEQASVGDNELASMLETVKSSVNELKVEQVKQQMKKLIEYLLNSYATDPKEKSGKQLIGAILQYTNTNYRTVTLEEISSEFYINKNYFCTLFKNENGVSYLEYLTKVRIDHAKRLLVNSDLKTYEIAAMVGYADQRYFSQVFRKYTGMKPTDYRKTT